MRKPRYVNDTEELLTLMLRRCVGKDGIIKHYHIRMSVRGPKWTAQYITDVIVASGIPQHTGPRGGIEYHASEVASALEAIMDSIPQPNLAGQSPSLEPVNPPAKRLRPWDQPNDETGS